MTVTKKMLTDAETAYANALQQYGEHNMATTLADAYRWQVKDALAAQGKLRELRKEMRERGIKRSSFMNGGHSTESYRYNADAFALESLIKKVTG